MATDEFRYLTVDDVLTLHETVVESDEGTEPGVRSPGDVEYVVTTVREGYFGDGPVTLHEKAAELLRLLVANHPFVDGNKRTALLSTVAFYALNGYALEYGDEVRSLLKRLAIDQTDVSSDEIVDYLESNSLDLAPDRERRYRELLDSTSDPDDQRNDYTDDGSS